MSAKKKETVKKVRPSFGGYHLKPEEEEQFKKLLSEMDISAKRVVRALIRNFIKNGGHVSGVTLFRNAKA
jgi:hypothetical protein